MNQKEALQKIEPLKGNFMTVVRIVFTDGEHHLVPVWSLHVESGCISYVDVHCEQGSTIRVPLRLIEDIQRYN